MAATKAYIVTLEMRKDLLGTTDAQRFQRSFVNRGIALNWIKFGWATGWLVTYATSVAVSEPRIFHIVPGSHVAYARLDGYTGDATSVT